MPKRAAKVLVLAFGLVVAAACQITPQRSTRDGPALSPQQIAGLLKRSFVVIATKDKEGRPVAEGSGFYVEPHLVVTNLHVLKWAYTAEIMSLGDRVTVDAVSVLALDRSHDICTLRTKHEGIPVRQAPKTPEVGERVFVLGNPDGP